MVSSFRLLRVSLDKSLCLVVKLQMQIVAINCLRSRWCLLKFLAHPHCVRIIFTVFPLLCFKIIHIYLSANGQLNEIAIAYVVINNLHNSSFWGNFIFLCASVNCVT